MKKNIVKKRKNKQKIDIVMKISVIFIFVYCVSLLYVLLWGFINSIKLEEDMVGIGGISGLVPPNLFGLPRSEYKGYSLGWHFENYVKAFEIVSIRVTMEGSTTIVNLADMMLNSLIYATVMSLFGVVTPVLVAYTCGKYNFKFGKVLYFMSIFVMLIPIVGSLSSELAMQKLFGFDNLIGVCIMKNKYAGVYFLVFYATFKGLSWSYAEAAFIDGAGHFTIFFKIMLPLVKTSIVAVFILLFIANWNDYYIPMMFLPKMPTVAFGLHRLNVVGSPNQAATPPIILSASLLVALPMIILFVALRNQIIGNITVGGVKG